MLSSRPVAVLFVLLMWPLLGAGSCSAPKITILYKGISEGGNNAQRFLPFAPEILAATPVVGGTRLAEILIHQGADEILDTVGTFLPQLRPIELWVGLSLFQLDYDPQDGHNFLRHLYREPLLPFVRWSRTSRGADGRILPIRPRLDP